MRHHRMERGHKVRTAYARWWMAWLSSRRRACQAAKSLGEAHGAFEPRIPEWDVLPASAGARVSEREPPELKHLSKGRKRKQHAMPGVGATETGTAQTEPDTEKVSGMWSELGLEHSLTRRAEVPWNGAP